MRVQPHIPLEDMLRSAEAAKLKRNPGFFASLRRMGWLKGLGLFVGGMILSCGSIAAFLIILICGVYILGDGNPFAKVEAKFDEVKTKHGDVVLENLVMGGAILEDRVKGKDPLAYFGRLGWEKLGLLLVTIFIFSTLKDIDISDHSPRNIWRMFSPFIALGIGAALYISFKTEIENSMPKGPIAGQHIAKRAAQVFGALWLLAFIVHDDAFFFMLSLLTFFALPCILIFPLFIDSLKNPEKYKDW